jgi:hypothetical protein
MLLVLINYSPLQVSALTNLIYTKLLPDTRIDFLLSAYHSCHRPSNATIQLIDHLSNYSQEESIPEVFV